MTPGELTLVTGVPNSGKSEWLDALAVNLAERHGWRFALCSLEKRPRDHARQLVEKRAGKPMLRAAYAGDAPRMTHEVRGTPNPAADTRCLFDGLGADKRPPSIPTPVLATPQNPSKPPHAALPPCRSWRPRLTGLTATLW